MIKDLNDFLKTIVNLLVKHPFATVTTIFATIALYIAYEIRESIFLLVVPPEIEAERFHEHLSASQQINVALENLIERTQAHSVVVRQFHNGKYDLTGIPFTKSSVTFSTLTDDTYEEEPISASSTSLHLMWKEIDKPSCITLDHGVDRATKYYMDAYELESIIVCPMINLLNYPVGTITVGYSKQSDMRDSTLVKGVAQQITGYLENGTS
ncbi:MAG: hypothetical protein ACO387_03505 [Flavobacteriaceae bacterium]